MYTVVAILNFDVATQFLKGNFLCLEAATQQKGSWYLIFQVNALTTCMDGQGGFSVPRIRSVKGDKNQKQRRRNHRNEIKSIAFLE